MSGFTSMLNPSTVVGGVPSTKAQHATPKTKASNTRQPKVSQPAGLHDNGMPVVHNLPAHASTQTDATGVQTLVQGYFDQEDGCRKVAQEPSQIHQRDQAVAAGVVALIDVATVAASLRNAEPVRRYIGASGIGGECYANLALCLRGFPNDTHTAQLLRIFAEGNRIEEIVVKALKEAGNVVEEVDPSTGKQWYFCSHGGHHSASLDGFITPVGGNERMTLEIKSMNRKMFEAFQKKGLELSHPHYLDQITDGIALAGMCGVSVAKCMVVAYCKDNSQYHTEIICFDDARAEAIMGKVEAVINHDAPVRAGSYAKEYQCQSCSKRTSCWEPNVTERECWHCTFATPETLVQGKHWTCSISGERAEKVCPSFKLFRPESKR